MGYQRNKYDLFVMKNVKGKECNIIWNVDNLKMLRVDSNIFSRIIYEIDAEYGKLAKIAITQGKINK